MGVCGCGQALVLCFSLTGSGFTPSHQGNTPEVLEVGPELDWSGQEGPTQTAEVYPAASLPSKQLFDCLQLLASHLMRETETGVSRLPGMETGPSLETSFPRMFSRCLKSLKSKQDWTVSLVRCVVQRRTQRQGPIKTQRKCPGVKAAG